MKSLFMDTLPAEIRMLIYRELLRDKKSVLKPQGESHNDCIPKKNLYPAILGVCKQTYAEASAILYEENSFSYRYPYMCIEEGGESLYSVDPPPRGAFERIKKVQIVYVNNGDFHRCPGVAQKVMAVVEHVADLGCDLKRLYLQLHFFEDTSRSDAARIANSQSLIMALANLNVENQIMISLDSDLVSNCELFEAFVNEIGLLKGWALTLERCTIIPNKNYDSSDDNTDEDEDEEESDEEAADEEAEINSADELSIASDQSSDAQEQDNPEGGSENGSTTIETDDDNDSVHLEYKKEHDNWETAFYGWTWTLRPATAITRTDVPTASKYRNLRNGT